MGTRALDGAGRGSIAAHLRASAKLTRELGRHRSQHAEEYDAGHVDALFVDEYDPVRHAAADMSAEKRAARMGSV